MAMKCSVCGAPLEEGKCSYCGYADRTAVQKSENRNPVVDMQETEPEYQAENSNLIGKNMGITPGVSRKSKMTVLLLCIFLGGLGVHRFYVGKAGTGILYLFTAGFFGIGWVIDIIRIATDSFRDGFGLLICQ